MNRAGGRILWSEEALRNHSRWCPSVRVAAPGTAKIRVTSRSDCVMKIRRFPLRAMNRSLFLRMAAILCLLRGSVAAQDTLIPELPPGWSIRRTALPDANREAASQKLGLPVVRLEHCQVTAPQTAFQMYLATAADESIAAKLEEKFLAVHDHDESYVARKGVVVAEIVKAPATLAARLKHLLAWNPPVERTWRVQLRATPVTAAKNSMSYQPLFEALTKLRNDEAGDATALEKLKPDFTFGNSLRLYAPPGAKFTGPGQPAGANFVIPPGSLPMHCGIPAADVEFTVKVREFSVIPAAKPDVASLTAATKAWPQNLPAIKELSARLKPLTPQERLERILAWVSARVAHGGKIMGSRYGVATALQQGYGRCWDASDTFIAACRACGLPARQTGGWLAGVSGHVWAEVWLPAGGGREAGWLPADPTTSWSGVSCHYIPWWVSEDGVKPLELWGPPGIERVGPQSP